MEVNKIYNGDCVEVMRTFPDNCIDTILCDPPYGLEFMGKKWDYDVPSVETWKEMLRVAKPGATLLCFAGTRTQHRMAVNIEDAGWILKDCIMWLYSTGFPKATDIKKNLIKQCKCGNMEAYEEAEQKTKYNLRLVSETNLSQTINSKDKQGEVLQHSLSEQSIPTQRRLSKQTQISEGKEQSSLEGRIDIQTTKRELSRCKVCQMSEKVVEDGKERWICNGTPFGYGTETWQDTPKDRSCSSHRPQSKQQSDRKPCAFCEQHTPQEVREWGSHKSHGLKPAYEPIIVAMKPNEGSYAQNALKHGVSGLNIDGGRIEYEKGGTVASNPKLRVEKGCKTETGDRVFCQGELGKKNTMVENVKTGGRFPANIILDEEAAKMLDEQSGELSSGKNRSEFPKMKNQWLKESRYPPELNYGDKGGASRFFYVAKASKAERNMGCEGLEEKVMTELDKIGGEKSNFKTGSGNERNIYNKNNHPTVKPIKLMEYLCLLTKTPTGGIVLDPFAGSGTTLIAAKRIGRPFIGIEKEEEYVKIAEARLKATPKPLL